MLSRCDACGLLYSPDIQECRSCRQSTRNKVKSRKSDDFMGYIGIGPEEGTYVDDEQAYEYALERCLHGSEEDQDEFHEMLVDWFYSGNWERGEGD